MRPVFLARADGVVLTVMPEAFLYRIYAPWLQQTAEQFNPDHPIWNEAPSLPPQHGEVNSSCWFNVPDT